VRKWEFVKWLGQFAEGENGKPSSRRVIALMAGTSLSISVISISIAYAWYVHANDGPTAAVIGALTVPLCALAGVNYVMTRPDKAKPDEPTQSNT